MTNMRERVREIGARLDEIDRWFYWGGDAGTRAVRLAEMAELYGEVGVLYAEDPDAMNGMDPAGALVIDHAAHRAACAAMAQAERACAAGTERVACGEPLESAVGAELDALADPASSYERRRALCKEIVAAAIRVVKAP
jgi:hypothetical protein